MNIYIITNHPFPYGMAATNRIKCYAKAIIRQDIPCKILIYHRTEVFGKKPRNTKGHGIFEGVEYNYIGRTPLRGKNKYIRAFNDYKDKINLLLFLKRHLQENDIVIGYCGNDIKYINLLIKLIHLKKAKFVRDLCELPYGTGKETQKTIKKRKYILKKQFPSCDGIIAISDTLYALAQKHCSPHCKIVKIPILVDYDQYCFEERSSESNVPYIFHAGTLYEQKDGFIGMLEAFGKATELVKKPILFISTGTISKSPHHEEIKRIINQYHLKDKVFFTGYISDEELKENLSKASLVIINKYLNQQNTYCFSTKLGEYLAAGKPVIITNVGEAMNWLKNGESAYIVEPNDTDLLAKAIVEAFNNPEKRKMIGINGKKICKDCFDYRNYGKKLQLFFNTITQSNT